MIDKRITYRRTMEYWGRRDSREPVEYKWTRGGTRIRSGSAHHKFQLFSWPTFFSFFFWLHLALKDSPGSWVIAPGPPNLSFSIPFDQREAVRTVSTKEKNISNDTADILLHSAFQDVARIIGSWTSFPKEDEYYTRSTGNRDKWNRREISFQLGVNQREILSKLEFETILFVNIASR